LHHYTTLLSTSVSSLVFFLKKSKQRFLSFQITQKAAATPTINNFLFMLLKLLCQLLKQ
jgi:hypothetical protein